MISIFLEIGVYLAGSILWLKSLHIIAVIAWMAGLFYLPRLYVYHTEATDQTVKDTLAVMERKLLKIIMNPAMIIAWILGLLLIWAQPYVMQSGWMHVKLTAVFLLSGYHGFLGASRKKFLAGTNKRSSRFWRLANEIPTVLMIIIVIMAVVQPF